MLKIYHVRGTRSVRPIWLCHELELAVEIEPIDFSSSFRNSPEWRAISPAGKVPALADDSLTMFESGAMVEYILERYGEGRLRPAQGTAAGAAFLQWCWFSEATLSRPVGLNRLLRHDGGGIDAVARDKVQDCLLAVEQALVEREFLLGAEFSAADIMMGYSLWLIERLGLLGDEYPHALAYLLNLKSREGFRRALAA